MSSVMEFPNVELKAPFCPKCKHSANKQFCYRCGTKLVEGFAQCKCGNELGEYDKFCEQCGEPKK